MVFHPIKASLKFNGKTILLAMTLVTLLKADASATIYKCVTEDGVTIYSDQPCGQNAQPVFEEQATTVNEALGETIAPCKHGFSVEPCKEYFIEKADRIGRLVFPGKWLHASKATRAFGSSGMNIDLKPRPDPKIINVARWIILLHYGLRENPRQFSIRVQFKRDTRMDTEGVLHYVVTLESISIKNEGQPFTPDTMKDVTVLRLKETGEWVEP